MKSKHSKYNFKQIFLILTFLVLILLAGCAKPEEKVKPVAAPAAEVKKIPKEITIGVLLPLTGDLAAYGKNVREAILIAEEDINDFLTKLGLDTRVKFLIEDTETKPTTALTKLQALAAKGVKIYIGPMTSAEVRNIKTYADVNKLLIISPSSTAADLALKGDFIYRTVPDDTFQGKAIAKMVTDYGIKNVVVIHRGDAWGDGLYREFSKRFKELGGNVIEAIRYSPEAKEFSAEVKKLADLISDAVKKYGEDKVAVVAISFGEIVTILKQASGYDILMEVVWFGSDGTAKLDDVVKEAGKEASEVKLYSTLFAPTESLKYKEFYNKFKEKTKSEPHGYSVIAYDTAWIVVYSILLTQSTDSEKIAKILPEVAKSFFGASGWMLLNEAGDRAAGDYDIWMVVEEEGKYIWKKAGYYSSTTDSVTFLS